MEKARPIGYADVKMYVASAVAEMHKQLIEDTNKQIMEAFLMPAVDFVPGTHSFEPITMTRSIAAEDITNLFDLLLYGDGAFPRMRRPDSEWFDE